MYMYKGDEEVLVEREQIPVMEENGWSTKKPKENRMAVQKKARQLIKDQQDEQEGTIHEGVQAKDSDDYNREFRRSVLEDHEEDKNRRILKDDDSDDNLDDETEDERLRIKTTKITKAAQEIQDKKLGRPTEAEKDGTDKDDDDDEDDDDVDADDDDADDDEEKPPVRSKKISKASKEVEEDDDSLQAKARRVAKNEQGDPDDDEDEKPPVKTKKISKIKK